MEWVVPSLFLECWLGGAGPTLADRKCPELLWIKDIPIPYSFVNSCN